MWMQSWSAFGVLPLNNPPHFPRYNGAQEKSIRDLKTALDQRHQHVSAKCRKTLLLTVEVTIPRSQSPFPALPQRGRTCLCRLCNDDTQRQRWTKRQRQTNFRLLLEKFGAMIGNTTNGRHLKHTTAWRVTVEAWLRCQGLITIRQNQKTNVSTTLLKCWSHN